MLDAYWGFIFLINVREGVFFVYKVLAISCDQGGNPHKAQPLILNCSGRRESASSNASDRLSCTSDVIYTSPSLDQLNTDPDHCPVSPAI